MCRGWEGVEAGGVFAGEQPARSRVIPGPPGLGISLREVTIPDSPQAELVEGEWGGPSILLWAP